MDKNKHCHCHDDDDKKECHCHEGEHECKCHEEGHEHKCKCHCHDDDDEDEEKEELENKVWEYVEAAQRLQADFDNYRKKATEQIQESKFLGIATAVEKLLPVLDSIAGAKKMITDEKLLEGFILVENQIINAFTSLGVEKIEAVGKAFNPQAHNALAVQCNPDAEDDIVLEEYQAGYKINEKVIRYSQVIVNKKEE